MNRSMLRKLLPAIVLAGAGGVALAASDPGAVTYYPSAQVQAAFAKGAVLHDAGSYMIHASRREAAGQVEVHDMDTDIIYVLDGSTTFVTGGTMLGGQATAPGEVRGVDIRDGQTRRLGRGDVIVVPKGTPHWFKEVSGPVLYYVVKVR